MDQNHATPPLPRRNKSFPVREDFWSIDATFTLINAWGEKFLQLNRGNLRQKHWLDVADAVNLRHGHVRKTHRTDVQCKNRMDTLKKKYKSEKCKVLELGYVSQWPFFQSLDSLIGCNFKPSTTPQPSRIPPALPPPPSSVPVGLRTKRSLLPVSTNNSLFQHSFSLMAAAAAAIDGSDQDSDTSSSGGIPVEKDDDPYHQLAEAIGRFAEVYERVENAKQRQMVELEKQRMHFTKDLELQRMKLLIESQVQLEQQFKRIKTTTSNSEPCEFSSISSSYSNSNNLHLRSLS